MGDLVSRIGQVHAAARRRAWRSWAEALIKIARMTLTIKLDGNWSSFQLANSAPPLSVTGSAIAPSARMGTLSRLCGSPAPAPTSQSIEAAISRFPTSCHGRRYVRRYAGERQRGGGAGPTFHLKEARVDARPSAQAQTLLASVSRNQLTRVSLCLHQLAPSHRKVNPWVNQRPWPSQSRYP